MLDNDKDEPIEPIKSIRKTDIGGKLFVGIWVFLLFLIITASIILKDAKWSAVENRDLQLFQKPTLTTLFSGDWGELFEDYCLDQTAGREVLLRVYNAVQESFGMKERNGYVVGKDDYILMCFPDYTAADYAAAEASFGDAQLSAMLRMKEAAESYGGKLIYLNIPHKNDFLWEKFTENYENGHEMYTLCQNKLLEKVAAAGIDTVETEGVLREHEREYLYLKTDNHYTFKGAYYVYQALLEKINTLLDTELTYPEWVSLDYTKIKGRMIGSYYAQLGDTGKDYGDYLEFGLPPDMPYYERYESGALSFLPLISKNCHYNAFMSGNYAETVIKTEREELPSILYIGFSYKNALEVMSVYNFNEMHAIDPRYYEGNLCDYIRENKIDIVVVVRNDVFEGNDEIVSSID